MSERAQVLLAAILFGTTGTAQALGPDDLSPLTVGAARIVLGGGLLAVLALLTTRPAARMPLGLVLLAGAAVALYQVTFFEAVDRTGVAVGAVVAIGTGPVVAGLLERAVGGPWPGRRWLGATVLAVGGIAALGLSGGDTTVSPTGVGLALVSGTAYAAYTVVAKRVLVRGVPPVRLMGAAFGSAAVLLLPVLALGDTAWLHEGRGVALAAYLALGPTVVAYVLFARGLRHLAASEVTTIVLAEPVTATILGVTALDETLGVASGAGVVLVLAGIAMLALPGPRRAVPA